jgi:hypothetical protein
MTHLPMMETETDIIHYFITHGSSTSKSEETYRNAEGDDYAGTNIDGGGRDGGDASVLPSRTSATRQTVFTWSVARQ